MRRITIQWNLVLGIAKRAIPVVIGLAVLILMIAWLAGAFQSKIPPGQLEVDARKLSGQPTDVVHEITKTYIEESVGTLKASSRTEISAKVLATIDEIKVTAGDVVKANDVLIRLNSEQLDARVAQAKEALKATEATRKQAEMDFGRAEELLAGKAIPKSKYDGIETQLKVARAEEARATQALSEATIVCSYATIKAPKGGRVVDRLAEPGDTAQPGRPLLVIYDAKSLRLEAPVLEKLAVTLQVDGKLTVHIDALNRDVEATIDEIVPQADAPSRSFLVKATLPRDGKLYEGMFGRLLIPAGERRHLCLATDAIQEVGQLQFVDVVLADKTLQRRLIKTGRLGVEGRIEVLSGIRAGERVVLRSGPNQTNTRDGVSDD